MQVVQQLDSYSIEGVIHDVEQEAPDLLQLFNNMLSRSDRNIHEGALSVEKIKSIVAPCTLLNARTSRANGFQLLLSIMVITCSTSMHVTLVYTRIYI